MLKYLLIGDAEVDNSYYLENVRARNSEDPRHFLCPSDEEIKQLTPGKLARLIFKFRFKSDDCCVGERMWVEISEIDGERFKGYLTNMPLYIMELSIGDIIEFSAENIATVIVKATFDENQKAIISNLAIEKMEINWALRAEPIRSEDSGWQLFRGGESDEYLNDPKNATIISLWEAMQIEPRLENVFGSTHDAFAWNDEQMNYVED